MSLGTSPTGRRAAFGFIFVCAVANAMSFGLMIPILPNLIKSFYEGLGPEGSAAAASNWNMLYATLGGTMSFLAGPVLGLLSDRFGRRPVLLVSILGLGLDFLFMAFAPSPMWLLAGRLVSGITSGAFSTANAYVADVTAPEDRARNFGLIGSAFTFGFLAGPAIGGILGNYDLRWPFFAAAALCLVNFLYGLFVLPESLPAEKRIAAFDWRKANPLGSLALLRSHPDLMGLAGIQFFNQLGNMVWPSVFVLYTGTRYGWDPQTTGLMMMAGSIFGVGVQSFLVGPIVKRFGELRTLIAGAVASAAGTIWCGFATRGIFYIMAMPVNAFSGLIVPGLQGLMTRRVADHEQGQLQGANQCLGGLASIIGPIIFNSSFSWAAVHPRHADIMGLPLLIAGALMIVCLLLAIRFGRTPRPTTIA